MTSASVEIERQGSVVVAALRGDIDITNASQISSKLIGAAPNDAPGLIVDLSGVTYLDSRGVHLLFDLAERLRIRDQRLHVVIPEDALIRRVVVLARLDVVVPLFTAVQDAAAQMARVP